MKPLAKLQPGDAVADRDRAILWARKVLKREFVIFDSETTVFGDDAEIVQLGVLSCAEEVLIDALVKPSIPIPAEAAAIHGIDDAAVENAQPFISFITQLDTWLYYQNVIVYNVEYDRGVLGHCLHVAGLKPNQIANFIGRARWCDAMLPYAAFVGEKGYYGDYRWQKLPSGDHIAIGDCRAVLRILYTMADARLSTEGGAV